MLKHCSYMANTHRCSLGRGTYRIGKDGNHSYRINLLLSHMFSFKKIRNIIFIGVLLYFIGQIISMFYELNKATRDDHPILNNILPKDYLDIFPPGISEKIAVKTVFHYKHRSAIGSCSYDNRFTVEIVKIDSSFKMPVNKAIVEKFENSINTSGGIFVPFKKPGFETQYQLIGSSGINKINLTLYGDSIKTVLKNDSITSYYLKLKTFSVTFNVSTKMAIFADADQGFGQFSNIPIDLAFVRKNGALYFVLLAPIIAGSKLDPEFVGQLINHAK